MSSLDKSKALVVLKAPKPQANPPKLASLPRHVRKLMTMLQYKRPANSTTEAAFNKRYLRPMGARPDPAGNHWLIIPGNDTLLFSSHTDTVHKTPGYQKLLYGAGLLSAEGSNCLGADCGVGVWLMLEMIKEKIPATYIFHAEEEIGGHGSNYVAMKTPEKLAGIKYAIAFDRMGTDEIITHQHLGRTASDEFALSLAAILKPLTYEASEYGSFTDTANYMGLIPECTNIGVGYYKQHQAGEHLDIPHAMALRDVLCGADWSKLSHHRDPTKREHRQSWWQKNGKSVGWSAGYWDSAQKKWISNDTKAKDKPKSDYVKWWEDARFIDDPPEDFASYVKREHDVVAKFLETKGFSKLDIEEFIWSAYQ